MAILYKGALKERLARTDDSALFLDPLLDEGQIGDVSIDLRLGTEFLVSILTRKPFVGLNKIDSDYRGAGSYFRPTRREIGDRFVLYPHQLALGMTLEYVGLPTDIYADVMCRSSYLRLGVTVQSMVQPGYRGCFPIEMSNNGNNPIELVVGSRMVQVRLYEVDHHGDYTNQWERRKYVGNVRPIPSRAAEDTDLQLLERIAERR